MAAESDPGGLSSTESSDLKLRFYRRFQQESKALQEEVDGLANTGISGGERSDAVEHCLAGIARLSQEVQDASSYVPAYDQRSYANAIKALNEKLAGVRKNLAPRPKFSFKSRLAQGSKASRSEVSGADANGVPMAGATPLSSLTAQKNASALSLSDVEAMGQMNRTDGLHASSSNIDTSGTTPADLQRSCGHVSAEEDNPETTSKIASTRITADTDVEQSEDGEGLVRRPSLSHESSISISNKHDIHIIIPASATHAVTTGALSNLRKCIVDMSLPTILSPLSSPTGEEIRRSFASVSMRNIKRSLIIAGRIGGPIHITGLQDCVIAVACRQFRMHECTNVDVYLECGSHPIIEDCQGIRFAPLPDTYKSGDASSVNDQWDQVDDFKWLRPEPSPHWSIMPTAARVGELVWQDEVPGGPDIGLVGILKATGVQS